jgi:hypothetical protein
MTATAVTTTPQPVTAPAGSLAQVSTNSMQIGLSSATASTGPTIPVGGFIWPYFTQYQAGPIEGEVTLWVYSALGATLNTMS